MPCRASQRLVRIGVLIAALLVWPAVGAVATATATDTTLPLDVRIDGQGSVRSGDGRIDCSSRCAKRYRRGRVVTLTPRPGRYFEFRSWTAGCRGRAPTCVIAIEKATTVRAFFRRKIGDVDVVVGGPGGVYSPPLPIPCGGRVTCKGIGCAPELYALPDAGHCSGSFLQGIPLRLRPLPNPGALLYAYNGACKGAPADHCDIVPGDEPTRISATFRAAAPPPGDHLLTVVGGGLTSRPPGIDCPRVCSAPFAAGTVVTLCCRPAELDWTGNLCSLDRGCSSACVGMGPYCTLVVDGPLTVNTTSAVGAFTRYGVNVSVSGPGRVVELGKTIDCTPRGRLSACEGFFLKSAVIVLEARPDRGARFVGWRNSPACRAKTARRCRIKVNGKKDITAVFARR